MRKRKLQSVIQLKCPKFPKLFKLSDLSLIKNVERPETPDIEEQGTYYIHL